MGRVGTTVGLGIGRFYVWKGSLWQSGTKSQGPGWGQGAGEDTLEVALVAWAGDQQWDGENRVALLVFGRWNPPDWLQVEEGGARMAVRCVAWVLGE